jgi:hypothetical protein
MRIKRLSFIPVLAAFLAIAANAPAGGIADEPCMDVAGEYTNTCPPGEVGTPYSLRFVEREGSGCGPGRQTFHLDSGELPPGISLATDGRLSGVPTGAGTFQFYVEMREPEDDPLHCAGKRTQKQFTLKICTELGIVSSPAVTPPAEVHVPFRLALSTCGGVGELTWSHSSGALPAGLTLRAGGSIVGAPRVAGVYRFTVTATDKRGSVATYPGRITVAARLRVRTRRLPSATVGHAYRAKLAEVGGAAPMLWEITRGRLPRGIRLDRVRGVLAGTARKAGAHRVSVEVGDGLKVKATRTLTLIVRPSSASRRSHD